MKRYKMYSWIPKITRELKKAWFSLKDIEWITQQKRQSIYNFLNWGSTSRKEVYINYTKSKEILKELEAKAKILRKIIYPNTIDKSIYEKLWELEYKINTSNSTSLRELSKRKSSLLNKF